MATSGTTTFTVTRNDIIKDALIEVGAYDPNAGLQAADITDCARRLNIMVKSWNVTPKIYLSKEVQLTLTPGTESYTIGVGGDISQERPIRLESVRREDSSGVEVAIPIVPWQQYKDLPEKSTQAPVNLIMYDSTIDLGTLYVWPTGETGNTLLNVVYQREIEDFATASDNPDIEKTGYKALYLNLASNIWRMYNPNRAKPQDLMIEAEFALKTWEAHEEEVLSLFIQPRQQR